MDAEPVSPGRALRIAREHARYRQTDLAAVLGIARSFLNEIEHERKAFPEYLIDDLPDPIRKPVVKALVEAHKAEIAKLKGR